MNLGDREFIIIFRCMFEIFVIREKNVLIVSPPYFKPNSYFKYKLIINVYFIWGSVTSPLISLLPLS